MSDTPHSLLKRITEQNANTDWQELLDIYRPFIDRQIRSFPQLVSQADDICQEVATVLCNELPTFQVDKNRAGSFRRWLRTIVVHRLQAAARKLKKQPKSVGDIGELEVAINELSDPASLLAKQWDEEHDRTVLRQAMFAIKPRVSATHWEAFRLNAIEEIPAKVVAERLDISVALVHQVKSRMTKALKKEVEGLID